MSELDEIRRKYESGQLDGMKNDLAQFIVAHRSRIAAFRADEEARGVPLDDETAVKLYLIHLRSINPRKEIQEQLEEIRKETWIRGINTGCPPDPEAVANDWARQYSAAWRSHRLTTIVYVFEREKDRYLQLLRC